MEIKKTSIRVPSELKYIREVSSKILDNLASYGVASDSLFDIRLCTEEAVRNAIVHGNKLSKNASVNVSYWVENNTLNIEIEDEGSGFKPEDVPDPTLDDNIMRNSGRGVYLIKKLMDRVDFSKSGNKIKMEKSLK